MEIESPLAGPLSQVLAAEGQTVAAGSPLAVIGGSPKQAPVTTTGAPTVSNQPKAPQGKVTAVLMPKAGQSMEEGTIVKWHVKPGDTIEKGQVIFEVETDKATVDVEAADAGRLARIVLAEGQSLAVQQPVAYLADNDADVDAFMGAAPTAPAAAAPASAAPAAGQLPAPAAPVAKAPVDAGGRVKASPAARKLAAQRGVDLHSLGMGSGPGGRILSPDVPLTAPKTAPAAAAVGASAPAMASTAAAPVTTAPGGVVRRRMSKMRKAIAQNLSLSKQTIPHFYVKCTFNAEPLQSFYQGERAKYPCSINDVILMAVSRGMMEFPAFRSRIEGDEIVEFPSANIGIAVGMDEGLVVPVLVGADRMELKQIGAESKRLATNARAGRIEGMGKGLMTISNMGMYGVEEFSAIINPPEASILAVGTIREEVIVSGGTLRAGKVMTVTLSVDHRVIDGALAARFVARLKEILEYPQQLV